MGRTKKDLEVKSFVGKGLDSSRQFRYQAFIEIGDGGDKTDSIDDSTWHFLMFRFSSRVEEFVAE
jgi:hypothetical protein